MRSESSGFSETVRPPGGRGGRSIRWGSRRCSSMPGRRSTWRVLPRRWPKASDARAKSWRRAPRVRRSSGSARQPLVFPDDADDDSLHNHVALVEAERLHVLIGWLQPDPAAGFAIEALDRGALSMDQRDHRLARSEEHTSELQSHVNLVCRLLLEKKKK